LKEIDMAERGEDFVYVQLSKAGQEVAAGADGKGLVLGLGGAIITSNSNAAIALSGS
jgi:hypothetical protein